MKRFWRWMLARFRWSLQAVCEESQSMGLIDFHDYPDSIDGYPDHFVILRCERCGKEFLI